MIYNTLRVVFFTRTGFFPPPKHFVWNYFLKRLLGPSKFVFFEKKPTTCFSYCFMCEERGEEEKGKWKFIPKCSSSEMRNFSHVSQNIVVVDIARRGFCLKQVDHIFLLYKWESSRQFLCYQFSLMDWITNVKIW